MDVRRALRWIRGTTFEATGLHSRALSRIGGLCAVVLTYHRVIPADRAQRDAVEPGMYVTPQTFSQHVEWLQADLRVLPLAEIVDCLARGRSLPSRACAITFDDGWRDNFEYALPALAARRLPATIFAVTRRVGTSGAFWPDELSRRLRAVGRRQGAALAARLGAPRTADPLEGLLALLKSLAAPVLEEALYVLWAETPTVSTGERELLTWEELVTLDRSAIDIESHGATHAILTSLSPSDVEAELSESRDALVSRGLGRHSLLAYPSGRHNSEIQKLAAAAGYRAAVTTRSAFAGRGCPLFEIPRIGIHDDISRTRPEFRFSVLREGDRI